MLRCKRASMLDGSLDMNLTVDKNLTLKSFYHYLVKLYKHPPPNVSTVGFSFKDPPSSLTPKTCL
jgi:hypothetical protein